VAAETLIIWGEHDRLVSPVYAQEFAGLIPGSRVEIIEGAGHVPQWEQLDTVQPLVRDFLGA
jgi:pimeloyl-ACP methyl ester carboxylesterase